MHSGVDSRSGVGRHRRMLVVLGLVAGVLVGCASADDSSSPAGETETTKPESVKGTVFSDSDFGFNFTYPKGWTVGALKGEADLGTGAKPAAELAVGFDEDNAILLARYDLQAVVTAPDVPDLLPELDGIVTQFAGTPLPGTVTEIGGLPAVRYEEFALPGDPDNRSSVVVFVFDGNAEYELNCQSNPEGSEKLHEGCDQMLSTLRKK